MVFRHMNAATIVLVTKVATALSCFASEKSDVEAAVHLYFENVKQQELPSALAMCDSQIFILDAIPPHAPPIEFGAITFAANASGSCLSPTYLRGQAYLAAGQGNAAAAEFQKILDHSGIVWNCWTGALAHLGLARANVLQARLSQGAEADAARVGALAAYKDFVTIWKDADPDTPILREAKAEYAKLQ